MTSAGFHFQSTTAYPGQQQLEVFMLFFFFLALVACTDTDSTITCEFDTSVEPASEDWRPEKEVILEDVKWLSQLQEREDSPSYNCAPTVLEMARAYAMGDDPAFDPGVINIIKWMGANIASYGGTGINNQGSGVNIVELAQTSEEYLNLPAVAFEDDLCGKAMRLEDLYNELVEGRPVVISTFSQEFGGGEDMHDDGSLHAVLMVGMTRDKIVFNDPGWSLEVFGAFLEYTIDSFLEEGWDEHGGVKWLPWPDADGDGVPTTTDCDDTDPNVDGPSTWHADSDGDGYGQEDSSFLACDQPVGHVADGTDCDDGDATVYAGAEELCDGQDNNCDGTVDEGAWPDADGDGVPTCNDCDDTDPDVGGPSTWYEDADGDGYVQLLDGVESCTQPDGLSAATSNDCSDSDPTIHPGAGEICDDGIDNDCDGTADEDCE